MARRDLALPILLLLSSYGLAAYGPATGDSDRLTCTNVSALSGDLPS